MVREAPRGKKAPGMRDGDLDLPQKLWLYSPGLNLEGPIEDEDHEKRATGRMHRLGAVHIFRVMAGSRGHARVLGKAAMREAGMEAPGDAAAKRRWERRHGVETEPEERP